MHPTDLLLLATIIILVLLLIIFRAPKPQPEPFDVKDLGLFGVHVPTLRRRCDQYNHEPRCRKDNTDLKVL